MVKQLLADQMGLTFMRAMAYAWQCGRPLDIDSGLGAATKAGVAEMNNDMQEEDPYVTVRTHPCVAGHGLSGVR